MGPSSGVGVLVEQGRRLGQQRAELGLDEGGQLRPLRQAREQRVGAEVAELVEVLLAAAAAELDRDARLLEGALQGVGLGLAVARGLAESMGARIATEDTPGGGLTFIVDLPACRRPQEDAS